MALKDYNKKGFLAPLSMDSMAAFHSKILSERKEYQLRISDCFDTIKLAGKLETDADFLAAKEKLTNLIVAIVDLRDEIENQFHSSKS